MITPDLNQQLCHHFAQFISDHKKDFIERVLSQRTRYVTVVLEDIYQSQNASAVIRTCECLGIQDLHIVETNSHWETNKQVLKGSNKWLTLIRYKKKGVDNIQQCYSQLREKGYRIMVADPSPDGTDVHEVPLDKPIALVMGNEKHGSSDYAVQQADLRVTIPMTGFTESLNISVSTAISVDHIVRRVRQSEHSWNISEAERADLRLLWYRKIVRRADIIEQEFLRSIR